MPGAGAIAITIRRLGLVSVLVLVGVVGDTPARAAVGSWTRVELGAGAGSVQAIATTADPRLAFAGTSSGGVFKTTDGGTTWLPANAGLGDLDVRVLAIGPSNEILAGTGAQGVFESTDSGATWAASNAGLPTGNIRALAVFRAPNAAVLAGTDQGVFRRAAGGAWSASSDGLGTHDIRGLVAQSTPPNVAIAAGSSTEAWSLFRSTDGGASWAPAYSPDATAGSAGITAMDESFGEVLVGSSSRWLFTNRYAPGIVAGFGVWAASTRRPDVQGPPVSAVAALRTLGHQTLPRFLVAAGSAGVLTPLPGPLGPSGSGRSVGSPYRVLSDGIAGATITALRAGEESVFAGTAGGAVARFTLPRADLAVTFGGATGKQGVVGAIADTVVVKNLGPDTVSGVVVSLSVDERVDYPPQGYGEALPSQGSCSSEFIIRCDVGIIAGGASAVIFLRDPVLRPAGSQSNSLVQLRYVAAATVTAVRRDIDPSNDSAVQDKTVTHEIRGGSGPLRPPPIGYARVSCRYPGTPFRGRQGGCVPFVKLGPSRYGRVRITVFSVSPRRKIASTIFASAAGVGRERRYGIPFPRKLLGGGLARGRYVVRFDVLQGNRVVRTASAGIVARRSGRSR